MCALTSSLPTIHRNFKKKEKQLDNKNLINKEQEGVKQLNNSSNELSQTTMAFVHED